MNLCNFSKNDDFLKILSPRGALQKRCFEKLFSTGCFCQIFWSTAFIENLLKVVSEDYKKNIIKSVKTKITSNYL